MMAKFAAFNKKAMKAFGTDAIAVLVSQNEVVVKERDFDGFVHEYLMVDVTYTTPRFILKDGWKIAGSVSVLDTGAKFVRTYRDIPKEMQDADMCRSHRNGTRHKRRYVVVIENESSELKQVGGSCIEKYLPCSLDAMVHLSGFSFDPDECSRRMTPIRDGDSCFEEVVALIKENGFIKSKDEEGRRSTWEQMLTPYQYESPSANKEAYKYFMNMLRVYETKYSELYPIESFKEYWIKRAEEDEGNFAFNMRNMIANKAGFFIQMNQFPVFAGAAFGWILQLDKSREDKEPLLNEWFGNEKERHDLELKLVFIRAFGGNYYEDTTYLYCLRDADGRTFTTWTSRDGLIEEGKTAKVKATIKEHTEYNGTKQTVLTRMTVLEIKE